MARDQYKRRKTPERKMYMQGEQYKTFSIRIPFPLWRTLTSLAEESNRSLNGMVNYSLEQVIYKHPELIDVDIVEENDEV